jgi:hypothetical protein
MLLLIALLVVTAHTQQTSAQVIAGKSDIQYYTLVDRAAVGEVVDADYPELGDPEHSTDIWPDMDCVEVSSCPAAFARRMNGAYSGCTKLPSGCIGSCRWCTGSASPGWFCVEEQDESCTISIVGQDLVPCGTITYWDDCYYSAALPAGEPFATPNKCYCRGAITTSADACSFIQCTDT